MLSPVHAFLSDLRPAGRHRSECEVRAFFNVYDQVAWGNRHIDADDQYHATPLPQYPVNPWVPDGKRRRIDMKSLVTLHPTN
jgi:hypothetical protein